MQGLCQFLRGEKKKVIKDKTLHKGIKYLEAKRNEALI